MKRLAVLLVALIAVVGLEAHANASLVLNGSFETGTNAPTGSTTFTTLGVGNTSIDHWAIGSGSVDWINALWEAADGDRSLDLAGAVTGSILTTSPLQTVVGQTYVLRFAMAGNPANQSQPLKKLQVTIDGAADIVNTYEFDVTGKTYADMGWEYHSLVFTADSETTILKFENATNYVPAYYGAALDDVSVSATPEPATFLIWSLLGGLAIMAWRRR